MSEVFAGKEVDYLIKTLWRAVHEGQAVITTPIHASVDGDQNVRFIHTLVPIPDANESSISRVFIYSERAE